MGNDDVVAVHRNVTSGDMTVSSLINPAGISSKYLVKIWVYQYKHEIVICDLYDTDLKTSFFEKTDSLLGEICRIYFPLFVGVLFCDVS